MPQGVLPFQYQAEPTGKGLTALGGLGVYLDFLYGAGIPQAADKAIGLRKQQGYSDGQMVVALTLLNLAGGDAVQSLRPSRSCGAGLSSRLAGRARRAGTVSELDAAAGRYVWPSDGRTRGIGFRGQHARRLFIRQWHCRPLCKVQRLVP